MIEVAGLVGRQLQLAQAAVGPGGVQPHVVGDLEQRPGQRAERRARRRHRVVRGQRRAEVRGLPQRPTGRLGQALDGLRAEARMRVDPGTDRGGAERQRVETRATLVEPPDGIVDVGAPAADHVAEHDRRRVLQVRAPEHRQVVPAPRPGRQRGPQPIDRQQQSFERLERRQVHHRRKHVVGRLAAVDVIVGMDRPVAAERLTGDLVGAVGDHLVGVHVGVRARAGLEHAARETRRPRRRRRLRSRRRGSGRPARCRSRPASGWCRRRRASTSPKARITTRGQRRASSPPIAKCRRARSVAAPHRRNAGTDTTPRASCSSRTGGRPSGLGGSNTTAQPTKERWRRS